MEEEEGGGKGKVEEREAGGEGKEGDGAGPGEGSVGDQSLFVSSTSVNTQCLLCT